MTIEPQIGTRAIGIAFLLILISQCAQAQNLAVGIKGGFVPSSDMNRATGGGSRSKTYTFGPTLEVKVPVKRLAIEWSVLYRRIGYNSTFNHMNMYTYTDQVRGDLFEIPLVLKVYTGDSNATVQPYFSGGSVVRILANAKNTHIYDGIDHLTGERVVSITERNVDNDGGPFGLCFGAGIRIGSGRIRFSPEVRYTGWFGMLFDRDGSQGFSVKSSKGKFEVMLNLSFVPRL